MTSASMVAVPRKIKMAATGMGMGVVGMTAVFLVVFVASAQQQAEGSAKALAGRENTSAASKDAPAGGTHGANPVVPAQTQQSITWSVSHPPERLRFPANSTVQFTVSAGEKEVKDVRLAQSTLQDVTTFLKLDANQLHLCGDDGKCDTGFDVPANTTRTFTLKVAPAFRAAGIFTGEIAVRIAGKPETQSFKLTVYSRTHGGMVFGAFLIALGLGLYFVINVLLRRRITMDEALLPAYQLRDTLGILRTRVEEASALTHVPMAALTAAINQLDAQLTPQALATRLPPIIISPWSTGTTWVDTFKAYLTPMSDRAAGLVVLVNSGIQVAIGYWTTFPAPVALALGQINALAPAATNAATAQTSLAPILQALQAAVNPPHAATLAPVLAAAPAGIVARLFTLPPDTQTLQVRLTRNTLWVWWLVALVALASGFYSMVLQNFGFGSSTDYIKCLFWGLGFSVAGTQLDHLTQTAVSGNFGITIPKA